MSTGPDATETGYRYYTVDEALKLYEREIATYRRELPRLLQEGQAGRYALIHGDEILGIWEKHADGVEAACERFGLQPYFLQKIDARDVERWAMFEEWKKNRCRS